MPKNDTDESASAAPKGTRRRRRAEGDVPEPPKGEHIFNATRLTELAIRFKEFTERDDREAAAPLLEEIVKGTRPMLQRLAQYEKFTLTVDLDTLVAAAEARIVYWLSKWDFNKGKLFSFFSSCAKRVFLSEVQRVMTYRQRYHSTGDNLEKIYPSEEHASHRDDAAEAILQKLAELTVRWGTAWEIGALRYLLACITDPAHDRRRAINAVTYAWGVSDEKARFFYTWMLFAMRQELYERVRAPFTEQDLVRHVHSYSFLPDLLDIIGYDKFKELVMLMGGVRLKIPTPQQLARVHDNYRLMREIERTPMDDDSIAEVAARHRRSARSAAEIYDDMMERTNPDRVGEHPLEGSGEHF